MTNEIEIYVNDILRRLHNWLYVDISLKNL